MQLREADEAIAKRHPDSLSNLIRATKAGGGDSAEVSSLKARVAELEAAAAKEDDVGQRRLHALRQELDKVKLSVRPLLLRRCTPP